MAAPRTEIPIVVLSEASPTSPVAGAIAYFKNRAGELITVYADSGATNNVITQPLTTDGAGRLTGWLPRGAYKVEITVSGKTPYAEYLDIAPGSDESVDATWLAASAKPFTWYPPKIIAGKESRTSVNYGSLTTPDVVENVVLPPNGLMLIGYQAHWEATVSEAARAAIFLDDTQLKIQTGNAPAGQESLLVAIPGNSRPLSTSAFAGGLVTGVGNSGAVADVTTGQAIYPGGPQGGIAVGIGGGGPVWVFAAAGTYDVNIQFKASSGTVSAEARKLWVAVLGN